MSYWLAGIIMGDCILFLLDFEPRVLASATIVMVIVALYLETRK